MRSPDIGSRSQVAAIEEQVRRLSGLEHASDADEMARSDVATARLLK
jgi:hypothetical protein